MTEETVNGELEEQELTPEQEEEAIKAHGIMMLQLLQSQRFITFLQTNYDFIKRLNEDTKEMTLEIAELPASLARERLAALAEEMGQEESDLVIASPQVLKDLG